MEEIQITYYKCEKCEAEYEEKESCIKCESRPVTYDNVEVGDKVTILNGDAVGEVGTIQRKWIISKDWGHYQADKYHHTVAVDVLLESGWSRMLVFDGRSAKLEK